MLEKLTWVKKEEMMVAFGLGWNAMRLRFSPFFIFYFFKAGFVDFQCVNSIFVYYLRTYKFHFSITFSLKMSSTTLFTHLKIIFTTVFSVSVFSFSKNKLNSNGADISGEKNENFNVIILMAYTLIQIPKRLYIYHWL